MKIVFASDVSFNYFGNEYPGDSAAATAMAEARECFLNADFSVINFESTFGLREDLVPIKKDGPNQVSHPAFAKYLECLAPGAACLANTHAGDHGAKPLLDTIKTLKAMGITPFGAGTNIDAAYEPVRFQKGEERVAVIGVCENEFGIATKNEAGAAGYSLGRVSAAISTARAEGYIPVMFFHGGNEHYPFPSPLKKELYRHFIDLGAGAVVAMHTHCPQGYELYRGAPIVYSMGNFYFPAPSTPQRPRRTVWRYGYMTALSFEKEGTRAEIIPYKQDFDGVHLLTGAELAHFNDYIAAVSAPIGDDALLQDYFDAWCIKRHLNSTLAKYYADEKDRTADVKNTLGCEAHNEVLTNEAKLIFLGRTPDERLLADIEALQAMQIPQSLAKK